jgi:hypothetical protein
MWQLGCDVVSGGSLHDTSVTLDGLRLSIDVEQWLRAAIRRREIEVRAA